MKGLLDGITILDLSWATAGPFGSMMLADMGADVIKIETPTDVNLGVSTRQKLDPDYTIDGDDLQFLALNRNKKSIVLNLKKPEGREIFLDLVKRADVVYANMRPAALRRLGIDHESLIKVNPRIISCLLTGYGSTGPDQDLPAFDVTIQATSGIVSFLDNCDASGRPQCAKVPIADLAGGIYAANAILAALLAREKTGQPYQIDVAMQDSMLTWLVHYALYPINFGMERYATERMLFGAFKAKDKYFVIAAQREGVWRNLCRALNHEEWLTDTRFASLSERMKNKDELVLLVENILAHKTAEEWLEYLKGYDVACARLNSLTEALSQPQVLARDMVVDVTSPNGRKVKILGNSIKIAGMKQEFAYPPQLGHDTDNILSGLGYPPNKIAALKTIKAVQ